MKHVMRSIRMAVAAAMFAGGMVVALPAVASANDYGYSCKNWKDTSHSWSADCKVTRGKARTVTECANGKTHYGKWVGRGNWKFEGECGVYALMATDIQWKK